MWTCPVCSTSVEPSHTHCPQCGSPPGAPAELSLRARVVRGLWTGALLGAIAGAMLITALWTALYSLGALKAEQWQTDYPILLLKNVLFFGLIVAVYGALVGLIPRKKKPGTPAASLPPVPPKEPEKPGA